MKLSFNKYIYLQLITYLMISGTQLIFWIFDVNGAATEASASDNEIPTWAYRDILK